MVTHMISLSAAQVPWAVLVAHVSHVAQQVEAEGDVATAFTLARILSNIPLSRGGPASVVIFDIHALQVRTPPSSTH